ncbi:MAG TPA: cytochrome c, partial [Chthoniobacteraceae bacterium]
FLCEDGYNPIAPLSTLARDEAFLATSDTDAATGREWVPFSYGKGQREPGPFYLVWPNSPADADHPWPYGVVALRIGARNALLGPALPRSEEFRRGFDLFQDHCMKCHSLNGVGGLVGVELNVPKNITEYWKAEELAAFVAKPESFRRNGKMPGFEHLGEETITEILKYIQHMGRHKLSPNEQGSGGK